MILVVVVLKTRGQIETIIERGIVLEVTAVEEVPDEQVVLLIDGVVHTREYVVIIRVPRDIQPVHGNSDPALERLDGINIVQDDRVVIRRLTAALAFVVAEEEGFVLDDRPA